MARSDVPREAATRQVPAPRSVSARRTFGGLARVAVVSYQRLVRDSIKIALLNHGFSPAAYPTPVGAPELWELARQLERFGAKAGLLICDLDDPRQLQESAVMIAELRLRWLVLTGSM